MQYAKKVLSTLQNYFGFDSFKKGQSEIIEKILNGVDVLGIMPTGAGKSICYQVPAFVLNGTTIVISPLISLMKDQVDALTQLGARAAFINSSLSRETLQNITMKARSGEYKLIYIAPERLEMESFQAILASMDIALIAVDEAHCISQWGHDFRPSYRKIEAMIDKLPQRPPVAAFTATATPRVKTDIINMLNLKQPYALVTGFDRENLYYEVEKPADKFDYLHNFLSKYGHSSGIIYCSTRKTVDTLNSKLKNLGYSCTKYHAGLPEKERLANQEAFIHEQSSIIVATVAFGMGIDKSNIRFVLHYNMPKTLENYYQEAGRGGRDGEATVCVLLYSPADIITNKFLIEKGKSNHARADDYKKLQTMIDYCHTGSCLRRYILRYFAENYLPEECGNCGNCHNIVNHTDITVEAQKILSCIKRTGERFGSGMVADVLRGARTTKIKTLGFENLSTFNLMPEYSKSNINEMIAYLVAQGLVDVKGGNYPVLSLNSAAYEWLKSGKQMTIKNMIKKESAKIAVGKNNNRKAKSETTLELDGNSQLLFESLRQLRKDIAGEQNVPPFVVFSDATLRDICHKLPTSETALLNVSGVGKYKLEKYGHQFLTVIKKHMQEYSDYRL